MSYPLAPEPDSNGAQDLRELLHSARNHLGALRMHAELLRTNPERVGSEVSIQKICRLADQLRDTLLRMSSAAEPAPATSATAQASGA